MNSQRAYFITKHGQDALKVLPYGSVIVTLGEEFLADVESDLYQASLSHSVEEIGTDMITDF